MSLETAQAWYEYGNVLLLKEEENPTNDLLGNVQQDPNRPNEVPEDEDVGEEDEPDNGAEEEGGEDGGDFEDEDEPEGDLQIAWEALDVSVHFDPSLAATMICFVFCIFFRLLVPF